MRIRSNTTSFLTYILTKLILFSAQLHLLVENEENSSDGDIDIV